MAKRIEHDANSLDRVMSDTSVTDGRIISCRADRLEKSSKIFVYVWRAFKPLFLK